MAIVTIKQQDFVWMALSAPPFLLKDISGYFSFEVPNFKYIQRKSRYMKNWDGKIRLLRNNKLYLGLLPHLIKFLEKNGHTYCIDSGKFYSNTPPDEEYIDTFIKSLNLPFELRDYQKQIVKEGIRESRATFLSATSSGKSVCIYALTKFWYDHFESPKILIVVPSINLVTQLESQFIEYSKYTNFDIKKNVSLVFYDSETKTRNTPITISTWQTAYQWPIEKLKSFNVIIFDEVHTAKSKEISKFLEKMTNAPIRYGFTGTLDDEKMHHFIIEGLFGPKIEAVKLDKLIEDGYATNLKIAAIELVHNPYKFKTYHQEIDYLTSNDKRNAFIINLAKNTKGNTMILFFHINHGKLLYEMAKKYIPEKNVYLIYGATEAELREKARRLTDMDSSGNSLVIASVQIFSVGVDIPSLKHLVLSHPTKSKIRLLQSIGRILRKHKQKDVCIFYDLGDKFSGSSWSYTWDHFLNRLECYTKENLKFKVKKVPL